MARRPCCRCSKPVKIEQGPPNKSLDDLLQEGVVDATIGTSMPESFRTNPNIGRLFPDFVERERDHYKRTKIFPIMHLVAIKKSVYEKYPFVATSLYNAFQRAKEIALERMYNERALRYMLPWLPRDIDEIHEYFGGDPWPYGVEANRPTLEALVQYLAGPAPHRLEADARRAVRAELGRNPLLSAQQQPETGNARISHHEQSRRPHQRSRHRQPHPRQGGCGRRLWPCRRPQPEQSEDVLPLAFARARADREGRHHRIRHGRPAGGQEREALALSRALHPRRRSWRQIRTSTRSCTPTPRISCRSASPPARRSSR